MDSRRAGYVVGLQGKHWRVREIKPDGTKGSAFQVHTWKDGNVLQLRKGLNVTFVIGTMDGPKGKLVQVALEVDLA